MRTIVLMTTLMLAATAISVRCQVPPADSAMLHPVPFETITMSACAGFWGDDLVITSDSTIVALIAARREIGQCADATPPAIDFHSTVLLGTKTYGDCHARYRLSLLRDDSLRCYHYIVREHYGGCRGTTMRQHWIVAPTLPEGYTVRFELMQDDDDDAGDADPLGR